MSEQKAKLIIEGTELELAIIKGTESDKAIDISKLLESTGYTTLDLGYKNTGSTTSTITFLDGDKGILRYRGYSIEELAEKASFVEVIYLLFYGELPTKSQLAEFNSKIASNGNIPTQADKLLESFPKDAHPMSVLGAYLNVLSAHFDNTAVEAREENMIRLIAQMSTITAHILKWIKGGNFIESSQTLGYVENFLKMAFGEPGDNSDLDPVVVEAMDKLLILHADHEQNCSTSTVRMVGSSGANIYASVAGGAMALWGPLHGGANQAVLEMLEAIKADGGDTDKWIAKAKDKEDPFRLMGFGHRVYKNFDPRAKIIKKACDSLLETLNIKDDILEIAKRLEEVALKDDYFVSRKLYPNVDFYSGIIYKALGFPTEMFTVLFALGRMPGWLAQWKELREQKQPIGRPMQVFNGATVRTYKLIEER
jgi:citrate synthase